LPPKDSVIANILDKSSGKYLVGLSYQRFTRDLYSSLIGSSLPPPKKERRKIFVSYSHRDKEYLERFRVHMMPLLRNEEHLLELWDDGKIKGGQMWDKEIKEALATTKVAVLLISADFFASDYIYKEELPPLLEAARTGEVTILSVILGYCR